jgi:hypothetical protein
MRFFGIPKMVGGKKGTEELTIQHHQRQNKLMLLTARKQAEQALGLGGRIGVGDAVAGIKGRCYLMRCMADTDIHMLSEEFGTTELEEAVREQWSTKNIV